MNKQKGFSLLAVILIIIVVIIIGGASYWLGTQTKPAQNITQQTVQSSSSSSSSIVSSVSSSSVSSSAKPSITSVLPSPALIGQGITVIGANLSGFEGDKNLWIENSAGQKGIIYGISGSSTDKIIRFTLADRYCTSDNSYSGLECTSYIGIAPGEYKIYASTPSGVSNKVSFSVFDPMITN